MSEALDGFKAGYEPAMEAFNAGDIERAFAATPEDVEFHPPPEVAEEPIKGKAAWLELIEQLRGTYGDWTVEPLEFVEPRGGVFAVRTEVQPKEPAAELPVVGEVWQVWTFGQGGLSVHEFRDRAAAFEAIGEEQPEGEA